MAVVGKATEDQRGHIEDASMRRVSEEGAQAIALSGTDLLLALDKPVIRTPSSIVPGSCRRNCTAGDELKFA
jgi:hypothetical protein